MLRAAPADRYRKFQGELPSLRILLTAEINCQELLNNLAIVFKLSKQKTCSSTVDKRQHNGGNLWTRTLLTISTGIWRHGLHAFPSMKLTSGAEFKLQIG